MHILTFVTPQPKPEFDLWVKQSHPEINIHERTVIDPFATKWSVERPLTKDRMDYIRKEFRIDVFQTDDKTDIKLFMADMDSTILRDETLDEMAKIAKIGEKVTAITERAMRGELDFEAALRERVQLLAGQPCSLIDTALASMEYSDGAKELLAHLKSKDVYCILVSGGFTQFTSRVADDLGFDENYGNSLEIKGGEFTGQVIPPILDKTFKLKKLLETKAIKGLAPENVMAIGDGANDLPMLEAAGLGISYYGKPLLRDAVVNRIEYTSLSALKYIL